MAVEWKETVLAPSHTLIESQLTRCLEFTQFTRPGALGTYCFDPKLDNGHWGIDPQTFKYGSYALGKIGAAVVVIWL